MGLINDYKILNDNDRETFYIELGKRIKKFREDYYIREKEKNSKKNNQNESQNKKQTKSKLFKTALSVKLKNNSGYISKIERGEHAPSLIEFVNICNALNCTPNALLEGFVRSTIDDYDKLNHTNRRLIELIINTLLEHQ